MVILAGTLEARLGEGVRRVGADHTLVIPPGVPHGFTSVGPGEAHILAFFSTPDPFKHTTYLEGGRPPPGVPPRP